MVLALTDGDFHERVRRASRAVVDFHTGTSAACVLFKPVYRRLALDFPHVTFFVADAADAPRTTEDTALGELPFVVAYRDGVLVEGICASDERRFRTFVERVFGAPP